MAWTRSASTGPSLVAIAWSSSESESRTEPSAARAIRPSASGLTCTPSVVQIPARCLASVSLSTRRSSNRWQRDSTVIGTLRISVVAKMNLACGGGSSTVFSKAFHALAESMWTSSRM